MGLSADCCLFLRTKLLPRRIDIGQAVIVFELALVARQEIPIERVERAGIVLRHAVWTIGAMVAKVTHLVDILAARGIGLAAHNPAIAK